MGYVAADFDMEEAREISDEVKGAGGVLRRESLIFGRLFLDGHDGRDLNCLMGK